MSEAKRKSEPEGKLTGKEQFAIGMLVISLFIIGFGVQQYFFQQRSDDADVCYQKWGETVVKTVNARTNAAKAVEEINQRHDHALDAVILDVLGIRTDPPTATEKDLDQALINFSKVKLADDAALAHLNATRKKYPYPKLNCS